MSRYIDADALMEDIWTIYRDEEHIDYNVAIVDALNVIDEQPTADVVEVKHGENICDSVIGHCEFKCSVCGADALSVSCGSLDGGNFNYCPNCGADMRGEEDEI